jgi:hypothetical protein
MLLSRLGRLCVVLPLVRWLLAVIGHSLDTSFSPLTCPLCAAVRLTGENVLNSYRRSGVAHEMVQWTCFTCSVVRRKMRLG